MFPNKISLGPIDLHFYGIIISTAIYIGYLIARKRIKRKKINDLFESPLLLLPLITSLIGARAYHVIDFWDFYQKSPLLIFNVSNGGLGIMGALFGFFLGLLIVAKIKKIKVIELLDIFAPSVLLAQSIGRIGNYINQEGFGSPTSMPWGVFIEKSKRPLQFQNFSNFHPTFFYEAILDLIFFMILIYISKNTKSSGKIFSLYLIFYGFGRFIAEFWRIDTWQISGVKVAHILSLLLIFSGIYLLLNTKNWQNKKITP